MKWNRETALNCVDQKRASKFGTEAAQGAKDTDISESQNDCFL